MASRVVAAITAVALTGACGRSVHYGYQYKLKQEFAGGYEPEVPTVEARALLAGAKTVAFFPPDTCRNIDADVARSRVQQLRASCGVLLSTLERAAEQAGYEVYSWQNLRSSGGVVTRPIDYAREAKVDVLFEINEFQLDVLTDSTIERSLSFYETDAGAERPLAVSSTLAQTCRDYDGRTHAAEPRAITGAIDIKTVQVSDGRNYWHYRKSQARSFGAEYPKSTFTGRSKTHRGARTMMGIGGVSIAQGITLIVLEQVLGPDDPATTYNEGFDPSPWEYVLIAAGAALLTGGIVLNKKLGAKPAPETVLCDERFRDAAPTATVAAGGISAEHTFTETRVDGGVQLASQLQAEMIASFIKVLSEAHGAQH